LVFYAFGCLKKQKKKKKKIGRRIWGGDWRGNGGKCVGLVEKKRNKKRFGILRLKGLCSNPILRIQANRTTGKPKGCFSSKKINIFHMFLTFGIIASLVHESA
jgi:hypothetical protein